MTLTLFNKYRREYLSLGYTPIPLNKDTKHPNVKYSAKDNKEGWTKRKAMKHVIRSTDHFGLAVVEEDNYICWDIDDKPEYWRIFLEDKFECFKTASLEATFHDDECKKLKGYHYYIQDHVEFKCGSRVIRNPDDFNTFLPIDTRKTWQSGTASIIKCYPSPKRKWIRPLVKITDLPKPDDAFIEFCCVHFLSYIN